MDGQVQHCCGLTDLLQQDRSDRRSVTIVVATGRGKTAPRPLAQRGDTARNRLSSIAAVHSVVR
jgi:hypothetical protein